MSLAPPAARLPLAAIACVLAATVGCASAPPASTPSEAAAPSAETSPEAAAPPPSAEATPAPAATTPADGAAAAELAVETEPARDWLVDLQGRRFFLEPLPKAYPHRFLEDGTLRTVWGIIVEVERQDDEFFYIRNYERDPTSQGPGKVGPDEAEIAAIKAEYVVEVPVVDVVGFAEFDAGLPRSGQWRNGYTIADMNGDGHSDIVHGPARKSMGRPAIFLGDSKGAWRRWEVELPSFPYDYGDTAVGDLDGDGRLDLVLGIHLRGVVALVQKQPGRFELYNEGLPFNQAGDAPGFSSRAVEVIDWNGDGRLDIAALG
jgi:hypothetical protein